MTNRNLLILDDMIEKLELFERKMNILENLLNDLRLNIENKKTYKSEFVLNITKKKRKRKKKAIKLPFNNFVIDTEDECSESE